MLFLNEKLFQFRKCPSLRSFCKRQNENVVYLFSKSDKVKFSLTETTNYFSGFVQLIYLTPQIAFFGYLDEGDKKVLFRNMVLMVFKVNVYKSRASGRLN